MERSLSRRDFLHVTGAAAFAVSGPPAAARTAANTMQASTATAGADGWFDGPMRWVQLTLVENDPGQYDPAFWLDSFKRIHADAARPNEKKTRPDVSTRR